MKTGLHAALVLVAFLLPAGTTGAPLVQLRTGTDMPAWKADAGWQWDGDWIGCTGDNTWRYVETGAAAWNDYQMTFSLRIDTASTRQAPKWEGGGWVWANYRNNHDIGGYEAGFLLRQGEKDYYRVMFSLNFQEIMLWSTRGGFLQVIPTALEAGVIYQVKAAVQGPRITMSLDEVPVIDYWDRTVPLRSGGVALGIHEGAASFSNVSVTALPAFTGTVPAHQANLRFREWKGARWAWDGNEPIFFAGADSNGHELKLVPGYKPQLMIFWHWLNYGDEAFYANKLQAFNILAEGEVLRFEVIATDKNEKTWLSSRCEVTVHFDAVNHRYLYDHVSDLIIAAGHSLRVTHPLNFTDPCIHNHVGSASPNTVTWETPHPWSVYRHVSGDLHKLPHNHNVWYPGYGKPAWHEAKGGQLDPDGGFWAIVGDPVANPVLSILASSIPDSGFSTELCGWAYDVHMRWIPVKPGELLQAGTHTVQWRLTTVDGSQGDEWLEQATFCAPEDLDKELLLYTAGIGHVETFATTVKWASPFDCYPLGDASLQDTTMGRRNNTSLRFDGPRSAASMVGRSVYSDQVLPDTRYEITAWVKTQDVKGEGPAIIFGGQPYYPLITGTQDWQQIGFVCKPDLPLHTVPFALTNSGSGTVWFDDFRIRALADGEQPALPVAPVAKPLANPGAAKDQLLVWTSNSVADDVGRTMLDLSLHGNHGRLEGEATVVEEDGKKVLAIDGDKGYVSSNNALSFTPPQSLTIWVKPGELQNSWNMIFTVGAWNRSCALFLYYEQPPYSIDFRPSGKRMVVDNIVPMDSWTHLAVTDDGKTIAIYVNGEKKKEEASSDKPWPAAAGPLVLGTRMLHDKLNSGFNGRLAAPILWNRALTADEVKVEFARGVQ